MVIIIIMTASKVLIMIGMMMVKNNLHLVFTFGDSLDHLIYHCIMH